MPLKDEVTSAFKIMREALGGGGAALGLVIGLVVYIWTGHLSDSASKHADLAVKIAELQRDQREYQAQAARDALAKAQEDVRQSTILDRIEKRLDDDDDEARRRDRDEVKR